MLAELAIATAAFKTVKELVTEGKELYEMGDSLLSYFDAKSKLQKEVNNSSKSDKSDLEEFLALEQIKAEEDTLRELMIYSGRAGMWTDWLEFQRQAARRREEDRKKQERLRIQRHENMVYYAEIGAAVVFGLSILGIGIWILSMIMSSS